MEIVMKAEYMRSIRIFAVWGWFGMVAVAEPVPVEGWLGDPGFWARAADSFDPVSAASPFRWNSPARQTARGAGAGLSFFGRAPDEVLVRFAGERPAAVQVVDYSRGDSGEWSRERFEARVAELRAALAARLGGPGRATEDPVPTSGVRREGLAWESAAEQVQMVWSWSTKDADRSLTYRPEYIRVLFKPAASKAPPAAPPASRLTARTQLRTEAEERAARVRREGNGDLRIDGIPMVDQGDKGYCAVATMERILRYYGAEVDQHELAQIAATSAARGTNPDTMIDSLKRVGGKLGYRVRVIEEFEPKAFMKLIDRYNSLAKKEGRTPVPVGRFIDVAAVYQAFDPALLREARNKQQGDRQRFEREVGAALAAGIPLAWSVIVGVVPEVPALTGAGGHMRVIQGVNEGRGELLYSDSWGHGHEDKRMSLDDAWAITTGLYLVEPLRR